MTRPGGTAPVPWLVRDEVVLAPVEVAATRRERRRGLLGRDRIEGVMQLQARSVHTFGMRTTIDVAACEPLGGDRYRVVHTSTVRPWRVTRPSVRASVVFEAEAGALQRLGISAGDVLEVR